MYSTYMGVCGWLKQHVEPIIKRIFEDRDDDDDEDRLIICAACHRLVSLGGADVDECERNEEAFRLLFKGVNTH